jgi:hypothetical protein
MKWHIKAILLCATVLLCFISIFFLLQVSKVRPQDYKRWADLVKESKSSEHRHQKTLFSEQHRKTVSKEIYIEDEPQRYVRLDSTTSILTLCTNNEQLSVTETFDEITACIQEVSSSTQTIYIIKAKRAFFDYTNRKFTAEHPEIFSYTVPGSVLPPFPLQAPPCMIAKADHITVELDTQTPVLHSTKLLAFFCDKERYIVSPYMSFFPKEDKALFIGTESDPVYLYDLTEKTALSTKKIETTSLFKPGKEKIIMPGDVRITAEIDIIDKIKNTYSIKN